MTFWRPLRPEVKVKVASFMKFVRGELPSLLLNENFFIGKYYRPSATTKILQAPLAVTIVPDINRNRSFGSFNTRDPPY